MSGLIFEKIRFQNYLSVGNNFIEVDLNTHKSTLIVGSNGSGKSTVWSAFMYCLYGKPYRNVNKPQLINSITGKNLLTEVEFTSGKTKYLVRRGMKPNIFEIYKNNKLIDQNSDSRDYQDMLEKTILKMNYKSACQIMMIGSGNHVPFMRLTTGDRRQVIEDFLDIQIFSIMNSILKDRTHQNKNDLKDIDFKRELIKQKIESNKKHIESLKSNNQELIRTKEELLKSLQEKINTAQAAIDDLTQKADELMISTSSKNSVVSKLNKVQELETELNNKKARLSKEIKFFLENDNCPTCKQKLDETFKEDSLKKRENKKTEIEEALAKLESKAESISIKLDELDLLTEQFKTITTEISTHNLDIRAWNKSIETLREEIKLIEENTLQIDVSEDDFKKSLNELKLLNTTRKELIADREIIEISSSLLKDTGIKTRIIRQYIPIINKLVNKYLSALDFFVNFELDEKFNEVIKSRFRDEFSYASFSEGEKMKIDLALMFAWRSIAKMRNSASTNLLVMDETFDASLDANGVEELLKILDTLTSDSNIFVISHRGADLHDKFDNLITFEKHSNFSRIV